MTTECPVCDESINITDEKLVVGQKVVCSSCSADLEVTEINQEAKKVTTIQAPAVEEDWGE